LVSRTIPPRRSGRGTQGKGQLLLEVEEEVRLKRVHLKKDPVTRIDSIESIRVDLWG